MYKNQIDYAEIPADAVILDVRNGSEHTEVALRRKHYFVELPQFDAKRSPTRREPLTLCGLAFPSTSPFFHTTIRFFQ